MSYEAKDDQQSGPAVEQQFLQARRLEAMDRLMAGLAEEFNHVHTAILSLAEFVAAAASTGAPHRADLDEIARQAARGTQLARHLLALSAEPPVGRRPESPNAIIHNLEPQIRESLGGSVRLEIARSPSAMSVVVDPLAFELIVLELTRHAARQIGRGSVSIATGPCAVESSDATRPVGLPPGTYFRMTIQARAAGAPPVAESGSPDLALALAETAAAKLNAFLTARVAGRGELSWSLYVPAALAEGGSVGQSVVGDDPLGETILVVEDEAPVRDVICRVLKARGYNVLPAKNGEDALAVASRYGAPIHLVVSDIVMPEMDGAVLFDHLRAWYPTLRFILISGYTRGALRAEQLTDVITEFLPKPFGMDELVEAVDSMLARAAA
ncbi:MAG TPA: response regulator [Gemmatimonadaceae bacterium]|nr:response regulator [Gemmatimonadaceae bacterium]